MMLLSPPVNEKELRGATPNVVPRIYRAFQLCPFRHVMQFEVNHTAWEAAEETAKAGEDAVDVAYKGVRKEQGGGFDHHHLRDGADVRTMLDTAVSALQSLAQQTSAWLPAQ